MSAGSVLGAGPGDCGACSQLCAAALLPGARLTQREGALALHPALRLCWRRLCRAPGATRARSWPPLWLHCATAPPLLTLRIPVCLCAPHRLSCRRSYQGGRTAEAFIEYIKKELEADKDFARVEALDELVKGFVDSGDKKGVIAKVRVQRGRVGEVVKGFVDSGDKKGVIAKVCGCGEAEGGWQGAGAQRWGRREARRRGTNSTPRAGWSAWERGRRRWGVKPASRRLAALCAGL